MANSILVITPYWHSGTWVFDDPDKDLHREPFVSGAPEILSDLAADIPKAKQGFRLLFSSQSFPGYQAEFNRTESEHGGTWYRAADGRKGWLCPALFKYFPEAPEHLYARAEELSEE